MSAPYVNITTWIPIAIFVASILGSGHCVAMCGGLVLSTDNTLFSRASYHLGRLAGYLFLGALAGWIGEALLEPTTFSFSSEDLVWFKYISWGTAGLLGFMLMFTGIRVWQGRPLHVSILPTSVLTRLYKKAGKRSIWIGLLTAFLPCGWLHSFLLGAIANQNALQGVGIMFAFWLGTLPALSVAPLLIDRIFRPVSRRFPKAAAIIFISTGIICIGVRIFPSLPSSAEKTHHHSCH